MTAACHTHNRSTNSQGRYCLVLKTKFGLGLHLGCEGYGLGLVPYGLLTSLLIAIDGVLGFGKEVHCGPGDRRPPVRYGGKSLVEVWRKKTPKPAIFSKLYYSAVL